MLFSPPRRGRLPSVHVDVEGHFQSGWVHDGTYLLEVNALRSALIPRKVAVVERRSPAPTWADAEVKLELFPLMVRLLALAHPGDDELAVVRGGFIGRGLPVRYTRGMVAVHAVLLDE